METITHNPITKPVAQAMVQPLNVFILNDNVEVAGKLRRYLMKRFGSMLNISLFFSSRSCMKMLNSNVHLVVVDDYLYEGADKGTPGIDMLKKIKEKNPQTEVIILTSHEDIGTAVEAMKNGARGYIVDGKEHGAWQRVQMLIDQTIKQPIRYFVAEYGVNVFVLAFIATFVAIGLVAYLALKYVV